MNRIPFTWKCDISEFAALGVGYSLYFRTVKFLISYIAFQLVVCVLDRLMFGKSTLEIYADDYYDEFLFWSTIMFVYWMRYKLMSYFNFLKTKIHPGVNDFSVALGNLPLDKNLNLLRDDLVDLFDDLNNFNGIRYTVKDVTFCFYTKDYVDLLDHQDYWKNKLIELNEKNFFISNTNHLSRKDQILKRRKLTDKLLEIEQRLRALELEFADSERNGTPTPRFIGKAFVTFKNQLAAFDILEKYDSQNPLLYRFLRAVIRVVQSWDLCRRSKRTGHSKFLKTFLSKDHYIDKNQIVTIKKRVTTRLMYNKDTRLVVLKAVNPNNINWKHMGLSHRKKQLIRIAFFSASMAILFLSFYIIRQINNFRFQYVEEHSIGWLGRLFFNAVITSVIILFNWILNQFIFNTIQFEFHEKQTREFSSMIQKVVLKMCLNSTLMVFLLCFHKGEFDGSFMIFQLFMFNTTTVLVYPFLGFWDTIYFYKLFMRFRILSMTKLKYTQNYINWVFENTEYNIVMNYSMFIFFFVHLVFYSSFFPFWVFLEILCYFCANYFAQKHLFITRSSCLNDFRDELNHAVLNILDYVPAVMLVSQFLKKTLVLQEGVDWGYSYFKAFLCLWTILFPNEKLIDYLFIKSHANYGEIDNYKSFRKENYRTKNPFYFNIKGYQNSFSN